MRSILVPSDSPISCRWTSRFRPGSSSYFGRRTLPYVLKLTNKGWREAVKEDSALAKGLNIVNGKICFKAIADAFKLDCVSLKEILEAQYWSYSPRIFGISVGPCQEKISTCGVTHGLSFQ
ncbi:TPA: hypothetical protein EYP66_17610 [Candidatus Poribacteria bacterium]|nr:hypothetical protein [Candidatus Poribacteria bacterium]